MGQVCDNNYDHMHPHIGYKVNLWAEIMLIMYAGVLEAYRKFYNGSNH